MKRFVSEKLEDWLNNSRKALLVTGARQVGKTYIIRKFLKNSGVNFFEINFIEKAEILNSLKKCESAEEFEKRLSLYAPQNLSKNSIIFFDEIQEFPEIVTKIKFLVDKNNFKYILSGSMLGVELKSVRSMPVGYVDEIKMYPMNLFEFALALGVKKETLDYIKNCFEKKESVDEIIHKKMLNLFYNYLIVGGMPSVVKKFVARENLESISEEQTNITNFYKADFIKYEQTDKKLRIISIYENIPSQLNKQNLRFIFTYLNKELKFDRYENSFLWLKDASVCIPVHIAQEAKTPLVISKENNLFKLFFSDVGLLVNSYPLSVKNLILNFESNNKINNGALFENFVAQELLQNGLTPFYFKNKKIGEIDFLIELDGKVLPLKIKSGTDYKKHSALNNLLDVDEYKLEKSIVFCTGNVEVDKKIIYLPIYMLGFLKEQKSLSATVDYELFKF